MTIILKSLKGKERHTENYQICVLDFKSAEFRGSMKNVWGILPIPLLQPFSSLFHNKIVLS